MVDVRARLLGLAQDALENEVDAIGSTEGAGAMTDEPVRIVPYDPSWPERFEQERAVLATAIGDWVLDGIHHVGSASVPGPGAKPIIDILVGVRGLEESSSCFDRLGRLEYLYAPYRSGEMHWFCKPHPSRRTHHLHLVPADSPRFRDELAFGDHHSRGCSTPVTNPKLVFLPADPEYRRPDQSAAGFRAGVLADPLRYAYGPSQ
jgi:GrpB-like predicted nucleotidyltransferase (UPF0157 family)